MTIFCKTNFDGMKITYCKVEMILPKVFESKPIGTLETIHEKGQISSSRYTFSKVTKVAMLGPQLIIYESTKQHANPLAFILLKNYQLQTDESSIILAPVGSYCHKTSIRLYIKSDKKQKWKNSLYYKTCSPSPESAPNKQPITYHQIFNKSVRLMNQFTVPNNGKIISKSDNYFTYTFIAHS